MFVSFQDGHPRGGAGEDRPPFAGNAEDPEVQTPRPPVGGLPPGPGGRGQAGRIVIEISRNTTFVKATSQYQT